MNQLTKILILICLSASFSIPFSIQAAPVSWDFSWELGYSNPPGLGGGEPSGFGLPFQPGSTVSGSVTFESTTPDTGFCSDPLFGFIYCPTPGIGNGVYNAITNLNVSLPTYGLSSPPGALPILSTTPNGIASFSTDSGVINVTNALFQANNPPPVIDSWGLASSPTGNVSSSQIPLIVNSINSPSVQSRYWEITATTFSLANFDGTPFNSFDLPTTLLDTSLFKLKEASITFELFEADGSTINGGLSYTMYAQSLDIYDLTGSGSGSGSGNTGGGNSGGGSVSVPESGSLALLFMGILLLFLRRNNMV